MPDIINWKLVANPVNWAIILLMVLIAGFGLHIILPGSFSSPSLNQ